MHKLSTPGLLNSLVDSVKHLEGEQARRVALGAEGSVFDKARSLLHRLLSATNRRMHKGFPEMIAYIMEKPEYIASMEFVPFFHTQMFISGVCAVESAADAKLTYSPTDFTKRVLRPGQVPFLDYIDYGFRSEKLVDFPFYFFIAACDAHAKWKTRDAGMV